MDLKHPELAYWETALSGNIRVIDLAPYVSEKMKSAINKENDFTKQMDVFFESRRIVTDEMTEKERESIPSFTIQMAISFPNSEPLTICVFLDRKSFELNGEGLYNKWVTDLDFRSRTMEENGITTEEKIKNAFAEREGELTDFEESFFGRLETQAKNRAGEWNKEDIDEIAEAFVKFCIEKTHETKNTEGIILQPLIIL